MHRSIVICVFLGPVVMWGCSDSHQGSETGGPEAATTPTAEGLGRGPGSQDAVLPFGGDVCQSLTAADIESTGYTLAATRAMAGLGGSRSMCVYTLASAARNTEVQVDYVARQFYLGNDDFGAESRTYLEGIGDDAYLTTGSDLWSLALKDGDYTVQLTERQDDGTKDRLKTLGAAIASRLE